MSHYLEYDYLFKVLLIGDSGVGKSNLLLRFVENAFHESYISTIGVDFKVKTLELDGKVAKLQIWDTAGQERFRTITSSYYRGAHAVIICFDLTDKESYNNLKNWILEKEKYCREDIYAIIVGTKSDLKVRRAVPEEQMIRSEISKQFNILYVETSAKDGINIEDAFKKMSVVLIEKFGRIIPGPNKLPVPINSIDIIAKQSKCC